MLGGLINGLVPGPLRSTSRVVLQAFLVINGLILGTNWYLVRLGAFQRILLLWECLGCVNVILRIRASVSGLVLVTGVMKTWRNAEGCEYVCVCNSLAEIKLFIKGFVLD